MGNFVSNNLVDNVVHSDDALYNHFISLAQRSFNQELYFYKKLNIDTLDAIPKSPEETVLFLTDKEKFKQYQETLSDSLYGKNTHFIKYFYDKDFIGYLSGKAISAESVLNHLEEDLAEHMLSISDDKYDKPEAIVSGGNLDLDKTIKIIYEVNKNSDFIEINPKKFADFFKNQKKLALADIQKKIAELIQKEKQIQGRIAFKNKKELSDLFNALKTYIYDENKIVGNVVKKNKGYYITRKFDFGISEQDNSLGEVLFGTYGRPNPVKETDGLIKKESQITYTGLLNDSKKSVAKDIITALNAVLVEKGVLADKSEEEINEITSDLISSLIEGMLRGKSNLAVKGETGNKRIKNDKGESEMFELNFSNPNISNLVQNGEYKFELRGGADMFATLFSDKFKSKFQELLTDDETVQTSGKNLVCKIPIIREDKNLFFNKLNNSVSAEDYSSDSIRKNIDNKNFQKQLAIDAKNVAEGFFNVILSVIQTMEGEKNSQEQSDSNSFSKWWGTEGNNTMTEALINLIKENPGQIYEILTKKDTKQIAGMIGETVFGAIVRRKMLESSDSIVQMLGQTAHGNGEAAVDLKLLNVNMLKAAQTSGPLFVNNKLQLDNLEKQRLSSVGFQLKNYTAAKGNKEILYATDNKLLSDTNTMKRYLQASFLNEIQSFLNRDNGIFFKGKDQEKLEPDQEEKLIEIGNILTYHLPYFMRFDEAQMIDDSFGIEQNNFYIVNFKFVPSSVLFYLMGQVIEKEKEKKLLRYENQYFYFSTYETGEERKTRHKAGIEKISNRNFLDSYWQFREIDFKNSSENNLIKWHNDRLAINFTGVSVSFGDAFDKVIQQIS